MAINFSLHKPAHAQNLNEFIHYAIPIRRFYLPYICILKKIYSFDLLEHNFFPIRTLTPVLHQAHSNST